MVICRLSSACLLATPILFSILIPAHVALVQAWGIDGHRIICSIAQQLVNPIALEAMQHLLPNRAAETFPNLCSWADDIRYTSAYSGWSPPLHYISTPDRLCNFVAKRDCFDDAKKSSFCASGAIWNYTRQLEHHTTGYNMTESLLFLSHIVGDIHQPLHVGFKGDSGGSSIKVLWFSRATNLHSVWDKSLLLEDLNGFYGGNVANLTKALMQNITTVWSSEPAHWKVCSSTRRYCPETYAVESIGLACQWAYKGAASGTALSDQYFLTRLPVLHKRLAQAGVRLAEILNKVFAR
jgi:hypothetical protein